MTEGGIASWKVQPGEAFSAGDVLLEIETDKATIDVEAQDDGIMGKILVSLVHEGFWGVADVTTTQSKDGSSKVPVGQVIAILAEEGDDISAIEVPSDIAPEGSSASASSSSEKPSSEASSSSKSSEEYTEKTSSVKPGPEGKQVEAEGKTAKGGGMGQVISGHESIGNMAGGKPLFPSVMRLCVAAVCRAQGSR